MDMRRMGDVLENSGALMNEERALDSRSEYDWVKDRLLFFETAEAGQDFGSKTMRKTFYLSSSCAAHPRHTQTHLVTHLLVRRNDQRHYLGHNSFYIPKLVQASFCSFIS